MTERKIRVLIAKPGLDGHDRGAKVIARALRDAGMEVIYTGLRQTPDVVGLSILSGAHNALVPAVIEKLHQNGLDEIKVFIGGIIPQEDIPNLLNKGVYAVYGPGTDTHLVAEEIKQALQF